LNLSVRIGLLAPPWAPIPPSSYGGIELVVDLLARGFKEAGHEVLLFATGDSTCPVPTTWVLEKAEGDRIGMAVPEMRHVLHGYEALKDCDIIHDHSVAGPLLYRLRHDVPPVVTTIHGPFNEELTDLYGIIGPNTPIICVSNDQRSHAPQIPVRTVIHHGIEPEAFPLGDGSGGYCLYLGRMAPDKGAHRAAQAAAMAGAELIMIGKMREPWEERYFHNEVEPHLGPKARYLGEVLHKEKLELLANARCLLFPITWPEPFGLVMLEALACGTPVLAFPYGAVPEVIEDGVTGFICSDEASMAKAISRVDELDRSRCRQAVEGYFSWKRMVAQHIELFEELVGSR